MGSPGCKGKTLSLLNLALLGFVHVNLETRHAWGPSFNAAAGKRVSHVWLQNQQIQAWKQAIDKQNGKQ